jgi:hypothetical protein
VPGCQHEDEESPAHLTEVEVHLASGSAPDPPVTCHPVAGLWQSYETMDPIAHLAGRRDDVPVSPGRPPASNITCVHVFALKRGTCLKSPSPCLKHVCTRLLRHLALPPEQTPSPLPPRRLKPGRSQPAAKRYGEHFLRDQPSNFSSPQVRTPPRCCETIWLALQAGLMSPTPRLGRRSTSAPRIRYGVAFRRALRHVCVPLRASQPRKSGMDSPQAPCGRLRASWDASAAPRRRLGSATAILSRLDATSGSQTAAGYTREAHGTGAGPLPVQPFDSGRRRAFPLAVPRPCLARPYPASPYLTVPWPTTPRRALACPAMPNRSTPRLALPQGQQRNPHNFQIGRPCDDRANSKSHPAWHLGALSGALATAPCGVRDWMTLRGLSPHGSLRTLRHGPHGRPCGPLRTVRTVTTIRRLSAKDGSSVAHLEHLIAHRPTTPPTHLATCRMPTYGCHGHGPLCRWR